MRLEGPGDALVDAADAAVAGWVVRCVERLAIAYAGVVDRAVLEKAAAEGERARSEVIPRLRALLEADIDRQWTTPLAVLREAVRYPTAVLREAGVPPVERDDFEVAAFPDDVYGLSPARFADIDDSLTEPGIVWGAWKAMEHKARHGS